MMNNIKKNKKRKEKEKLNLLAFTHSLPFIQIFKYSNYSNIINQPFSINIPSYLFAPLLFFISCYILEDR